MHPIIAEHLLKETQRVRRAEAAQYRLAHEARAQRRESRRGDPRSIIAPGRRSIFAVLRSLGS